MLYAFCLLFTIHVFALVLDVALRCSMHTEVRKVLKTAFILTTSINHNRQLYCGH